MLKLLQLIKQHIYKNNILNTTFTCINNLLTSLVLIFLILYNYLTNFKNHEAKFFTLFTLFYILLLVMSKIKTVNPKLFNKNYFLVQSYLLSSISNFTDINLN